MVLTHYSQRYGDEEAFAEEARTLFPDVHASRDLDRIPMPPRHRPDRERKASGAAGPVT